MKGIDSAEYAQYIGMMAADHIAWIGGEEPFVKKPESSELAKRVLFEYNQGGHCIATKETLIDVYIRLVELEAIEQRAKEIADPKKVEWRLGRWILTGVEGRMNE